MSTNPLAEESGSPALRGLASTDHAVPYPWPKRLTDRLVPLALLVLLSPILALVVLTIALDMLLCPADRGTWLYRERRFSRGREFDVLKFRVLREDVLERMRQKGREHVRPYEADGKNLTWAGRHVIKRWYLDEIPQLLNILEGDMSLVGPRPWPLEMVREQLERGVTYRSLVLAGWTGPAQRQKTHLSSLREAEALDLEYVDACRTRSAWALWRYDVGILSKTLRMLLHGQGMRD
jgi:putative colanic acid biosynthesis UDP-glucose lipid carrier transferase